ncbi:hypothetical protein PtB15_16B144 [Puccinia triticina]|nr:hypothetical protein PtB15_16B144 [Puccinia triticina]
MATSDTLGAFHNPAVELGIWINNIHQSLQVQHQTQVEVYSRFDNADLSLVFVARANHCNEMSNKDLIHSGEKKFSTLANGHNSAAVGLI